MKKPIVVGVVDTDASRAALAWAMDRAARRGLPVLLVHAVDIRWIDESFTSSAVVKATALELLSKTAAYAGDTRINTATRPKRICDAANTN